MSDFKNVTVVRKANVYFDGRVTSRTILFPNGTKKTLGVMMPGDYEFNTGQKEVMEIQRGEVDVWLPGAKDWQIFREGSSFDVPAGASFKLRVKSLVDYCCSYLG